MSSRLSGRIAIVTGSSSGLGRSVSLHYAAEGARLVCADLRPTARPLISGGDPPVPTHESILSTYGSDAAIFVKCDASSEEDVESVVKEAVRWGGRLDIMICNAGISTEVESGNTFRRLHETPSDHFDITQSINARGVWLGNKYAIKQMLEQEPHPPNYRGDRVRGWIINTASILGLVANQGASTYVSSKHTVVGITKQTALDYASDKIHVNAICPGYCETALIDTNMAQGTNRELALSLHPWGTLVIPEDIGRAAVFLASDDAAFITGHTLVVDGGYITR